MSTWSVKYPLSIIVGGDTKQSGFTKVKDEFTSLYNDLSTHAHDGTADNGDKINMSNITQDAGFTMGGVLNEVKGDNIASAATVNLTTATGNLIHITGSDAITAVTLGSGMRRTVIFDGALTLTHHATNNNLPGGENITTAAGDRAEYWSDGTTVYCTNYQKANGSALLLASSAEAAAGTEATKTLTAATLRNGLNTTGDAPIYACRAWVNFNGTGVVAIRASGNVSSITDSGTGEYTINFTTAMQDANYSVAASTPANYSVRVNGGVNINTATGATESAPSTSGFRILTTDISGAPFDPKYVSAQVFR